MDVEWVFKRSSMPGGTFPIDPGEPPRPNPANPGGPRLPGRRPRKATFFQGYYRTSEEAVARELIGPDAVAAGITLHRGPHISVVAPLPPRWKPSPMQGVAPASGIFAIWERLPFLPISGDPDSDYDAFNDPLAVPEEGME